MSSRAILSPRMTETLRRSNNGGPLKISDIFRYFFRVYFFIMLRRLSSVAFLSLAVSVARGQIVQNTVTVTASSNPSVQPDQVNFSLDVTSNIQTGLSDVLAALQGIGVTIANFTGINTGLPYQVQPARPSQPSIDWSFTLQTPIAKTKDTISALTSLQQNLAHKTPPLILSFSLTGTTVSRQLQQSQPC